MLRQATLFTLILSGISAAQADGLTPVGPASADVRLCYASGSSGPQVPCVLQGQTWIQLQRPADDASGMGITASATAPSGSLAAAFANGQVSAISMGIRPTNTAAQNDAAAAAAIAALGALGGGTIDFPCGTFAFGAIDNNVQGVLFRGPPAWRAPSDDGTSHQCVEFYATKTGTFIKHRTPYGQGLSKFWG